MGSIRKVPGVVPAPDVGYHMVDGTRRPYCYLYCNWRLRFSPPSRSPARLSLDRTICTTLGRVWRGRSSAPALCLCKRLLAHSHLPRVSFELAHRINCFLSRLQRSCTSHSDADRPTLIAIRQAMASVVYFSRLLYYPQATLSLACNDPVFQQAHR